MGVTDQTELDWDNVEHAMGGVSKFLLQRKFIYWKRKIPEYKNKFFPEILQYMEREFLPKWKRSAGYSCTASTTSTTLPSDVKPWLQKQKNCVGGHSRWPVKLKARVKK